MSDAGQVGNRIAQLLQERYPGKPRRRICAEAGVSYKTLSDALTGKTIPRYATAEKLAEYLGVTVNYLYTGEETSEPVSDQERIRSLQRQIDELTGAIAELRDQVAEDAQRSP